MTVLRDPCLVECVDFSRGLKESYSKVVFFLFERKTFYSGDLLVMGGFKFTYTEYIYICTCIWSTCFTSTCTCTCM